MSRASSKVAYVVMENENPGRWDDGTEIHAHRVFFEEDVAEQYIIDRWTEQFPDGEGPIDLPDWLWVEKVDIG